MNATFAELWELAGKAEVMTTGGFWVDKPGLHGQGRAFDLDGIFWDAREFVTLKDGWQRRNVALYLGVEAVMRRHFGTVLNAWYNPAHRDHFHCDDGTGVGFRSGSRSQTLFVQMALNTFHDAGLVVDGVSGPKTRAALTAVAGNVNAPATWLAFLDRTARAGLNAHV